MLQRRYDELEQFLTNKPLAAGAILARLCHVAESHQRFNDAVDPKELEQDLKQAMDEFGKVTEEEA